MVGFFFFKQKTAYELRISDWSSDVCSSDLKIVIAATAAVAALSLAACSEKTQDTTEAAASSAADDISDMASDAANTVDNAGDRMKRSEERRVGKEWVSRCRSRWSP